MKEKFIWMLISIITFGIATTTLTSCSDSDSATINDTKITGNWFAQISIKEKSPDCENYVLFSFDDNGIATTWSYEIYPNEPIHYSERFRRHAFYTVNQTDNSITINDGEDENTLFYYFNNEGMMIKQKGTDLIIQLHRPTKSELTMLATFNKVISSDDYVGKWINEKNEKGITTYTIIDINENGRIIYDLYQTNGEKCTHSTHKFAYGEYETENYDGKVLEFHNNANYYDPTYWWWTLKDNTLATGPADINSDDDEKEEETIFRPFSPTDKELIDKLDKMSNEQN